MDTTGGVLQKDQNFFQTGALMVGRTWMVTNEIERGDAQPLAKKEKAEWMIWDIHKDEIIEQKNSSWISPVVILKNKDGSSKFWWTIGSSITKKDSYPLPRKDDTLDTLFQAKIFSTLVSVCRSNRFLDLRRLPNLSLAQQKTVESAAGTEAVQEPWCSFQY